MNISIIGAGNVGSAVAAGAVKAGHTVTVTARDDAEVQAGAAKTGAQGSTDIPGAVSADVATMIGEHARGKVVIDTTNPRKADFSGLAVIERSGAEEVQDLLPGASVVRAFNTVFAANQGSGTVDGILTWRPRWP